MSLLSGTFYSIDRLAPAFQVVSHANPFFYIISGFRYGFLSAADSNVVAGALVLLMLNILLGVICYALLAKGWQFKACTPTPISGGAHCAARSEEHKSELQSIQR